MYNDDYYDDYYDSSDDNDYERDTFYALTDGNYGDYDDWKENGGDMDSLMDCLGYWTTLHKEGVPKSARPLLYY